MQCEEKKGKYKNIEELAMNSNFKYMCPFCRKENRQFIRSHLKTEKMIGNKTKRHCMSQKRKVKCKKFRYKILNDNVNIY